MGHSEADLSWQLKQNYDGAQAAKWYFQEHSAVKSTGGNPSQQMAAWLQSEL